MNALTKEVSNLRWTLVVTLLSGLLAIGFVESSVYKHLYDVTSPVVTMKGTLVKRESDAVVLSIEGEKHRSCKFIGLQANATANGVVRDAFLTRIDAPETGQSRPVGLVSIGTWRIKPVQPGPNTIRVFVTHECDERTIITKIAEVEVL